MHRRALSPILYLLFTITLLALYFPVANLGCAALSAWRAECSSYRLYLFSEDGLFEWLQVVVLSAITAICVRQALRNQSRHWRWIWMALALIAMFIALEEISWGQRIFDLRWPSLQAMNHQNETNLHNLLDLKDDHRPYWLFALVLGLFAVHGGWRGFLSRSESIALGLAAAVMLALYLTLIQSNHVYFYEFSELWIYGTGLWLTLIYSRLP